MGRPWRKRALAALESIIVNGGPVLNGRKLGIPPAAGSIVKQAAASASRLHCETTAVPGGEDTQAS